MHFNIGYWGQSVGDKEVGDKPQLPLFLQWLGDMHICRPHWVGGGGSPKSRQKEQNLLISVRDKGERVQKPINLCGSFPSGDRGTAVPQIEGARTLGTERASKNWGHGRGRANERKVLQNRIAFFKLPPSDRATTREDDDTLASSAWVHLIDRDIQVMSGHPLSVEGKRVQ